MRLRNPLITLGILAGLSAYIYFVEIKGGEKKQKEKEAGERVLPVKAGDVTAFTLTRGGEKVVLEKVAGPWKIREPRAADPDPDAVSQLLNSTMMFGHIETIEERNEHLEKIRRLQDETGGFTAFIAWTFQPKNTQLDTALLGSYDYLRTIAIARLYLDNFPNIQASWVTQGAKIAQLSLKFGANDMGSTMIEENVVRAAGVSYQMDKKEIESLINDLGFEARQRDLYYKVLKHNHSATN